jgi:hypothetical protein
LKSTARREVDVMMADAEIKAERLKLNAEERRLQLIEEVQEIKRQKIDFEVGLRGLLEKHIRMLDLNAVSIEHHDADSRMLEEPLPFVKQTIQSVEAVVPETAASSEKPVEEAEFEESEQAGAVDEETTDAYTAPKAPELSFDFDPGEDDNEKDLLK